MHIMVISVTSDEGFSLVWFRARGELSDSEHHVRPDAPEREGFPGRVPRNPLFQS
jgi:hypothetical protein